MATCCGTAVNEEYGAPPDCGVGVSCCDSSTTNFVDYEAGAKLSCPDMYLRGGCADQDPTIRQQIHTLCPKACGLCVISDDGDDYGGGGGDGDDDSNNQAEEADVHAQVHCPQGFVQMPTTKTEVRCARVCVRARAGVCSTLETLEDIACLKTILR